MYVCGLQVQKGLTVVGLILLSSSLAITAKAEDPASFLGVTVTPHRIEESMRYRRPRDPSLAARVQLFVFGPALPKTFDGKTPAQLLENDQWAWHDMAEAVKPPAGALTVWSFNGKSDRWGVGQEFQVQAEGMDSSTVTIKDPSCWISSVTFLSSDGGVQPDTLVLHVANSSKETLRLSGVRFWLPKDGSSWRILWPQAIRSVDSSVAPSERGYIRLSVDKLPLTYAAIELQTHQGSLWSHLRIKRESFDISGGWVHEHLSQEPYLNLLQHLHVNTGQIDRVAGYTDRPELYERYPIKLFNRLWPLEQWDTDAWLPKIHAVEFIGEPQYGGGKPMSPQEVFDKLYPYRVSRLPTSVTLSEERTWRWYAGLSDFPHYDAYRVVAPAADAWREYDRWGGERIRWGLRSRRLAYSAVRCAS